MISDCSSRFSSDWRSDRIPIVTLSKSISSAALGAWAGGSLCGRARWACGCVIMWLRLAPVVPAARGPHVGSSYVPTHRGGRRSEEHTSELQSRLHLVCRLLLEKKKKQSRPATNCRD